MARLAGPGAVHACESAVLVLGALLGLGVESHREHDLGGPARVLAPCDRFDLGEVVDGSLARGKVEDALGAVGEVDEVPLAADLAGDIRVMSARSPAQTSHQYLPHSTLLARS